METINLESVAIFKAVVEEGGVVRAAAKLHRVPSNVTTRIRQLEEFLALPDYVVLAAPVTPATTNLMNATRLALMKADACLINVGRGPLVDEAALAEALRRRQIAGAALDVFPKEPLPLDSPLWDVENLLITPHTAALTDRLWERHYALIHENLRRYLAHEPLFAMVDKRKGY